MEKKMSEDISDFLNVIDNAQSSFRWCSDKVYRMDNLTQDFLHKLEFENLDYNGRAKVAAQLTKCRREGREVKDEIKVLEPLILFLEDNGNKTAINKLKEVLGKTRKIEENMSNRVYQNRVYSDTEKQSDRQNG